VNTTEMVKTLAARLQISQKEARRHFHHLFAAIAESLQKGEKLVLRGFGAFEASPRQPRRKFDSSTQEFVPLPPQVEISFRPYQRLKEKIKNEKG
jgi:nucleoid DNA-binding protein